MTDATMEKKERQDYSELLKDPRWQKRRLEILNRDNWTCQICGAKDKMLHVHHTCYEKGKKPWEYPDKILITLCEECHKNEDRCKKYIQDHLRYFAKDGITNYELSELLELVHIVMVGQHDNHYISRLYEPDDVYDFERDPFNWPYECLESLANRRESIDKGE